MKINEIITEDADAGSTMAGNIASVNFPLFGKKKMIRRAVRKKSKGVPVDGGNVSAVGVGYTEEVKLK